MLVTRRTVLSAVALGAPMVTRAQTPLKSEYRVSLVAPPGTVWYQGAERFANGVRERTAGRINMKLYPGSSLVQGQQQRELLALREGTIDVLVGTTANWSGAVRDFTAFGLPFLMPDARAVDALLASPVLNQTFYTFCRRAGLEPLASAEYGYLQFINAKRRVATPADMRGLKIRVHASPMHFEVMNEFGSDATMMSFADALPALGSGAMDGLILPMEQFIGLNIHRLNQRHITRWNAFNELLHFFVAEPVWRSWSGDDQRLVTAAARDAAQAMTRAVRNVRNEDAVMKSLGVEVYTPTPDELLKWRVATRRVYARWKASINPGFISSIEQVVERASGAA
jgi:TRAP-type transport system periplasmic protein